MVVVNDEVATEMRYAKAMTIFKINILVVVVEDRVPISKEVSIF